MEHLTPIWKVVQEIAKSLNVGVKDAAGFVANHEMDVYQKGDLGLYMPVSRNVGPDGVERRFTVMMDWIRFAERLEWYEDVLTNNDYQKIYIGREGLESLHTEVDKILGRDGKTSTPGAECLNSSHPRYAPKLAAALSAWLAVDANPVGKTPKQALQDWLTANAARFGLQSAIGSLNQQGIEECAKIANWNPTGGAPRTPE